MGLVVKFYIFSLSSLSPFVISNCASAVFYTSSIFLNLFLNPVVQSEPSTMLNLNYFTAAAAALTLVSGVNAGGYPVMKRNQEPSQPSCTNFTPFKYAGCFQDPSNPERALLFSGPSTQNMTVETCVAFCKGMLSTHLLCSISNSR